MKKLLLLAIVVLGISAVSFGQSSVSASSAATIITPIGISNVPTDKLDFGTIAKGTSGGTVTVAPTSAGARSKTGDVTLSAIRNGRAAKFTVTGQGNGGFSIMLPGDDRVVTSTTNASNTMSLTNFTSTPSGTGNLISGTLDIYVGATLNISATQAAEEYTGTFPVTVNYN